MYKLHTSCKNYVKYRYNISLIALISYRIIIFDRISHLFMKSFIYVKVVLLLYITNTTYMIDLY